MPKDLCADRPQVKALNGLTIICEMQGCDQPAGFLFRTGRGPITAFCERHASESAKRQGIRLPEPREKVLRAGW